MAGRVIGLTGVAGCGKTTARDVLMRQEWKNVKMAGPLKGMATVLFQHCGLDAHRCIEGDLKEEHLTQLNGKSPRHVMQTLGTEWGRGCISETIWVDIARRNIEDIVSKCYDVIVDDIRFQNEADMIHDLGGCVVNIVGRGGIVGSHVSEGGVNYDMTIANIGTIEAFQDDVLYILHRTDAP